MEIVPGPTTAEHPQSTGREPRAPFDSAPRAPRLGSRAWGTAVIVAMIAIAASVALGLRSGPGAIRRAAVSTTAVTRSATTTTRSTASAGLVSTGGFAVDVFKLLDAAEPTVVKISFTTTQNTPFGTQQGPGAASGVIISADGLVLTNNHVVSGASDFEVLLTDGRTYGADVVGTAPDDDIGILKLRNATGLQVARLGNSGESRVGELVFAIGNALDLTGTLSVTHGIVSAKGRTISDGTVTLEHLIQTDAAINSGNSGGPLIDANGLVIGINTASISNSENLSFAIAIDRVKPIIAEIKAKGGVIGTKPSLGASTAELASIPTRVLRNLGVTATRGVIVTDLVSAGPAQKAGLQVGDVITRVDGKAVDTVVGLDTAIHARKIGDTVSLTVDRVGTQFTVKVTVAARTSA